MIEGEALFFNESILSEFHSQEEHMQTTSQLQNRAALTSLLYALAGLIVVLSGLLLPVILSAVFAWQGGAVAYLTAGMLMGVPFPSLLMSIMAFKTGLDSYRKIRAGQETFGKRATLAGMIISAIVGGIMMLAILIFVILGGVLSLFLLLGMAFLGLPVFWFANAVSNLIVNLIVFKHNRAAGIVQPTDKRAIVSSLVSTILTLGLVLIFLLSGLALVGESAPKPFSPITPVSK